MSLVVPWLVNVVVSELINIHSAGHYWISDGEFKCGFVLCVRACIALILISTQKRAERRYNSISSDQDQYKSTDNR